MRRRQWLVSAVTAASIAMAGYIGVAADNVQAKPVDMVILIDDTASMKDSDSSHLAATAIKKVADKLQGMDVNYALARYDLAVDEGDALTLGKHSVDELYNFTNGIKQEGKGTDAAMALEWAVRQLDTNKRPEATHAILLVGDGENSFYRDGQLIRTGADSDKMRDESKLKAESSGYDVYAMSINQELDPNQIPAEQYNAKQAEIQKMKDYFKTLQVPGKGFVVESTTSTIDDDIQKIVNSVNELQSTHKEVNLAPEEDVEHSIFVDDGTLILNVAIDHDDVLESSIKKPDGTIVNTDVGNIKISKQQNYTNYNIMSPEKGEWKIRVKNISGHEENIKIDQTTLMDMTVEMEANNSENGFDIVSKVYDKDKNVISDKQSLANVSAKLKLFDAQDNATEFPMTINDDGTMSASLTYDDFPEDGTYNIQTVVSFDQKEIASAEKPLLIEKPAKWKKWIMIGGIAAAAALLAALIAILKKIRDNKRIDAPGKVSIEIRARNINSGISAGFPRYSLPCSEVFGRNSVGNLGDLAMKYSLWYSRTSSTVTAQKQKSEFLDSKFIDELISKIRVMAYQKRGGTIEVSVNEKCNDKSNIKYYVNDDLIKNGYKRTININGSDELYFIIEDTTTGKKYEINLEFDTNSDFGF